MVCGLLVIDLVAWLVYLLVMYGLLFFFMSTLLLLTNVAEFFRAVSDRSAWV